MCVVMVTDVNDVDEEGATPLHFAARYKRMRLRLQEGVSFFFRIAEMFSAKQAVNVYRKIKF